VIWQVESDLGEQAPERAAEVIAGLEADLRQHLEDDGANRLPGPSRPSAIAVPVPD
jgi:hypothetical protein